MGFQAQTGARYLGGYVGYADMQAQYVDGKVAEWVRGIHRLTTIARSSSHYAFIRLQKSYQQEWQHLQRVVQDIS